MAALQPVQTSVPPSTHHAGGTEPDQPAMQPLSNIDLIELEDLQRRHEEERRAVAEIQYKMQQAA